MKKLFLTVLLFCLPLLASAQTREFRKTVDFQPDGSLFLETDKGSVRLTSWNENRIEIYARIEPPENVSSDYAQRAVDAAKIDVTGDVRSLTIRSNFDDVPEKFGDGWRSKSLPNIHYEIRAPRRLNLALEVDRSKVELRSFDGRVRLNTDRTQVRASDVTGEFRLEVDRGGNVELRDIKGRVELKSDRTDIELLTSGLDGDSHFDISRGELNLRVPASQSATISAETGRRESFYTDFGITTSHFSTSRVEGTINGGGARLSFQADRARINLRKL